MKYQKIMMMFVFLVLLSSGCVEQEQSTIQEQFTISDNATITSLKYRTISLDNMEVQELIINSTSMNLSIYSPTNELKARHITPTIYYQWQQSFFLLRGKSFLEMNSDIKAQKIQPNVLGSGTLEVTVLQDGVFHTVTIDSNSPEYQSNELPQIEHHFVSMKHFASESTFEETREIVEQWITSMPTYSFDGSNLTLDEHIREDTLPSRHLLIYTFTSNHEGYGDRSGEELTEAPTNHTIWVTFSQLEIRKAIIDESWDEFRQEPM